MSKSLIAVVLDGSGSMGSIKRETISALNKFIAEQQAVPGEALFTLARFSDPEAYKLIRDAVRLDSVKPVTDRDYQIAGNTALLDAMGKTIDDVGNKLGAMAEADRPDKIIFVVMTDGYENASREYKREQVMEKVQHQSEKYAWQFLFLGAGPDAIQQDANVGVNAASAMAYHASAAGVGVAINSTNDAVARYRSGEVHATVFNDADRAANS